MRKMNVSVLFAVLCLLGVFASVAQANTPDEIPKVDGTIWMDATKSEKTGYILGMATMIELEQAVQGEKPPTNSLINGWVQRLSKYTITDIVQKLDRFYQTYPDCRDRQVVEVLWYDFNPEYMKK